MSVWPKGVFPIHQGLVVNYLLIKDEEAVLIDTGWRGSEKRIGALLELQGLSWENLRAIVLTHGHLDHVVNVDRLKQLAPEAKVYLHRFEEKHLAGTYPYKGATRFCGWLEGLGRRVTHHQPCTPDIWLGDDDFLDLWHGLRVVHLPGHSHGHCGFYCRHFDLLFSGDLFSAWGPAHRSPFYFNSCPQLFPESYRRVAELDPALVASNHYAFSDPKDLRQKFDQLHSKLEKKWAKAGI